MPRKGAGREENFALNHLRKKEKKAQKKKKITKDY